MKRGGGRGRRRRRRRRRRERERERKRKRESGVPQTVCMLLVSLLWVSLYYQENLRKIAFFYFRAVSVYYCQDLSHLLIQYSFSVCCLPFYRYIYIYVYIFFFKLCIEDDREKGEGVCERKRVNTVGH